MIDQKARNAQGPALRTYPGVRLACRSAVLLPLLCGASFAHAAMTEHGGLSVIPVSPPESISPTGPWGLATLDQSTHTLYVAGMRGIDPKTNLQINGPEGRIRQAFVNMQHIAQSQGASLQDCLRLVVYTTDMFRFRPIANQIQEELWGKGPYPPRTIIEVQRLNGDDILEVEGTFHVPTGP